MTRVEDFPRDNGSRRSGGSSASSKLFFKRLSNWEEFFKWVIVVMILYVHVSLSKNKANKEVRNQKNKGYESEMECKKNDLSPNFFFSWPPIHLKNKIAKKNLLKNNKDATKEKGPIAWQG